MPAEHRKVVIPHPAAPYGVCQWCGEPILRADGTRNTRRRWHKRDDAGGTTGCLMAFLCASNPAVLRRELVRRNGGVCEVCGDDSWARMHALEKRYQRMGRAWWRRHRGEYLGGRSPESDPRIRALGRLLVEARRVAVEWQADHIVPLVDGGSFDLANVQVACAPCHKAKTAREARERASRGRAPAAEQLVLVAPVPLQEALHGGD